MSKKDEKDLELEICKSVLKELPVEKLKAAKRFFDIFSDFKRIGKLYGTYIEGVEEALSNTKNGKIYANFNIDGTVTGRLSNSGATNEG